MRDPELKLIAALSESYCGVNITGTKDGYMVRTVNGHYMVSEAIKLMDALVHVARFVKPENCTETVRSIVRDWDDYQTQLEGSP